MRLQPKPWCEKHQMLKDYTAPSSSQKHCSKCIYERSVAYREKNRQLIRDKGKEHYKNNIEKESNRQKEYRETNRQTYLDTNHRYYENNVEVIKLQSRINSKRYRKEHPEAKRVSEAKRDARKAGNGGSYTVQQWIEVCEMQGYKCNMCYNWFEMLTIDHIHPISKGGTNNIENIQGLCSFCNNSKKDKLIY